MARTIWSAAAEASYRVSVLSRQEGDLLPQMEEGLIDSVRLFGLHEGICRILHHPLKLEGLVRLSVVLHF